MMLGFFRATRFALTVSAAMAILAGAPTLSHAATGSVRIIITRLGLIVGGGSGSLHFQGKRYPLRVGGVHVSLIGAPRVDLFGQAYYMRTAGSIHGIYSVVAGEGAARAIRLRNSRGVVLELRGRRGVKPTTDLSGMDISLR
jgi:hypothetical protein